MPNSMIDTSASAGDEMYALVSRLYPICRSITGEGVRQTLREVGRIIPLEIHEIPSGTQVFDWVVPKEWNIREAFIANGAGERVIDFRHHNLHVLNYSTPIDATVSNAELKQHLFSLPEHPDWIPYRTSYYQENWGFCVRHTQYEKLNDPEYRVLIDADLTEGHLTYGEYFKQGATDEEVLISCHVCHPSLCNDNLSGIALSTYLARQLASRQTRLSYRFLFIPGTIGSIAWLALNQARAHRIAHGLVVVCVGDDGSYTYKRSRRGNSVIDRAVLHVLESSGRPHRVVDFYPYGYDERQYCSPGFNLAVGSLSRSSHGAYAQYHTSADDLTLVSPANLKASLDTYSEVLDVIEHDRTYLNLNPNCEPQLGKRGLYGTVGANARQPPSTMAMLWVLNLCDGDHTLLDIAERSGLPFAELKNAADTLHGAGLLLETKG